MQKNSVYVKEVTAEETHPLRTNVLRKGNTQNVSFWGDSDSDTFHLAAMFYGSVIGIASFYQRPMPPHSSPKETGGLPEYQLRGMAVDPDYRGMDCGTKLMDHACDELLARHDEGVLLWCHARTGAVGFYKKLAFAVEGEEYQIEDVGPHYLMWKIIS